VTDEFGRGHCLGDPKLSEDRLDARRQRLPRPVAGKHLALEKNDAKTVARTPQRTG
jgi:hypothetical protein